MASSKKPAAAPVKKKAPEPPAMLLVVSKCKAEVAGEMRVGADALEALSEHVRATLLAAAEIATSEGMQTVKERHVQAAIAPEENDVPAEEDEGSAADDTEEDSPRDSDDEAT